MEPTFGGLAGKFTGGPLGKGTKGESGETAEFLTGEAIGVAEGGDV